MTETSGATATDHLWFGEDFDDLCEAYCITLVRGMAPEALLSRPRATQQTGSRRTTGVRLTRELPETAEFPGGIALLPSRS
ncbi:DUF6461 domain-containing protein [Streptomyces sp. NPDC019890]|uniref:DUF6461 domain-containing protein n=1 Tax=Streptomyces sp. NPDC019890 TaxID=3365064 RepID=UPI00385029F8